MYEYLSKNLKFYLVSGALVLLVLCIKQLECVRRVGVELHLKTRHVRKTLEETLQEDKGTGCEVPRLNPSDPDIMKFNKKSLKITCPHKDWVNCYFSRCTIAPGLLAKVGNNIQCTYRDILYINDKKYTFGPKTVLKGNKAYKLVKSDHVKIKCRTATKSIPPTTWVGHGTGFRPIQPNKPPLGRAKSFNVLIFGFDSTSKNGFIRKMPQSYKYITKTLGATVLNWYNILGDGTSATLLPLLTGKTEHELPECRKNIKNSNYMDIMPFIFYKLKNDGYRTAYFEDMPWIGTFQYRFNGFFHQPADHYLRSFYADQYHISGKNQSKMYFYCVGGTPRYKLMMNVTDQHDARSRSCNQQPIYKDYEPPGPWSPSRRCQFLRLNGKRFVFTFIADISHDDFNMIDNADGPFVDFLSKLNKEGRFKDTLLIVMGDHGPRYTDVRNTLQGKLEERLPFMAIRLPDFLMAQRPKAQSNLKFNADSLTTAHDIHATVLDVIGLQKYWNNYKIEGADFKRGLSLLDIVPKNRSCSEAGIEPHWCICIKWEKLKPTHPLYQRTARALVDHINHITESQRPKCALRNLTSIDWVMRQLFNDRMLDFHGVKDKDGNMVGFTSNMKFSSLVYQVKVTSAQKLVILNKITVGPGNGTYEATITHNIKEDKIYIDTSEISRTNAYNKEPECISATYPHLNMFCYCVK